ncbi:MAG TPA: DUF5668 domain-containing protein [Terriglobales bacterium]
MNCANHPQNTAVAYCRTCGKPLCASCTRSVMGVVYCENCLAERVGATAPVGSSFQPAPGYTATVQPATGPNPALAGILAGFFPFGVGAVYCGQYAKGLAHLVVFVLLIVGASHATSDAMGTVFGLGVAAFWFYQLFDAIKSAKAIQGGQPAPDPFGLGTMFSPGDRQDFSRGIPVGAIVLIGLGVLFLLQNLGIWFLEFDRIWPLALIFLGVWLYAKRRVSTDYGNRSIAGPAVLVTIGVLSLIENLHGPSWGHTWPVILLVLGILKLMERGYLGGPPSPPLGPPPGAPSSQQSPTEVSSEVKNG